MYDVIIVGGGISGLYMSKLLSNKYPDYRICVLEQSDYFGGRIKQETATTYQGEVSFPSGGARFNKSHERVIRLLKSYNMIDELLLFYVTIYHSHKIMHLKEKILL